MAEKKENKNTISELGEFGLIEQLARQVHLAHGDTLKGIGDDAAVLKSDESCRVVTTDLLLEGIHFNLMYTPLKHLGYKAVVVNLSDVYAMNAIPGQITVSIGISSKMKLEMIEEIYKGINLACQEYGVDLVGGDTTASLTGLTISITAIGKAKEENIVYRNGARVNDLICVSGDLGAAYMGVQLLERENEIFKNHPEAQPDLSGYSYILQRQLKPEARRDVIEFFNTSKLKPGSMIDISDGLSSEIMHICRQSGTGCRIYEGKLPVHEETKKMAGEFNMDYTTAVMNGGEDYELLFTIPAKEYEKVRDVPFITEIGFITDKKEGLYLEAKDGSLVGLNAQGWNSLLD